MVVMDSRPLVKAFCVTLGIMLLATCLAATAAETKLSVCPVSLTNPDGQELVLEKYDLRVAVHGPLALTEMEMVFRNPTNRQIEGRFLYLLPTGATVSRFAKDVDGKLMEGEVVETQQARAVYREILHSMRDPALLEQDQGNRFSAKVFPIPANGTTRLVLSYSQVLALKNNERKLTIPLAGMPKIGAFSFSGVVQYFSGESLGEDAAQYLAPQPMDGQFVRLNKQAENFTPERDIELTFKPAIDAPRLNVIKAGNYQMVAYRADFPVSAEAKVKRDWIFYFDTSASGADLEARRLQALSKLLPAAGTPAAAWAFDVNVERLSLESPKPHGDASLGIHYALKRRHCLGATDLGKALKHIGETARATKEPARFVLLSDGIATWGKRDLPEILAELGEWPAQHVLHALVLGNKQDEKMLTALTAKTNGRVVVLPLNDRMEESVQQAVAELTEPIGQSFEFYDEGAAWIYPKTFRDVRSGSEMVVFCELKDGAKAKPGVVYPQGLGKVDVPLEATPAEVPAFAPLIRREAIAAQLAHLEKLEQTEKDAKRGAEFRKQRIELSVRHRVLCAPLTSLLVLETEQDYVRFKIDRTSLTDVLVAGKNGIELLKRKGEELALRKAPPPAPKNRGGEFKGADKKAEVAAAAKADELKDMPAKEMEQNLAKQADGGFSNGLSQNDALAEEEKSIGANNFVRREQGEGLHRASDAEPNAPPPPAANAAPAGGNPMTEGQQAQQAQGGGHAGATRPVESIERRASRDDEVRTGGRRGAADGKRGAPVWTKQLGQRPGEAEFTALRAQVEAKPRDRGLRNAYAHALAATRNWDALQAQCFEWLPFDPENPQVYEYLGKSAAGLNDPATALRALSSLAELAPNNAALLGRAGWVLTATGQHELAAQLFSAALKQRQDDPNLYRGLGLSLWQAGKHDEALKAYEAALKYDFHNRYGDIKRVLKEEAAYVVRSMPLKENLAPEQDPRVSWPNKLGLDLNRTDALRITLGWETDANDVDLHVVDPSGEECFYSHKNNASGLELYSDQTQGLGPEVIRCDKALTGAYHVGVKYFSAGPMGVSRGVVVVFKPQNGLVAKPEIVPFCLIPETGEGKDMRHLTVVEF